MQRSDSPAVDKKRLGVFYSPEAYAIALTDWALENGARSIFDPSFGGCAFLRAALNHLRQEKITEPGRGVYGADVDVHLSRWTEPLLASGVPESNLKQGDFLALVPGESIPLVDAIVGNPPYVRHHWIDADVKRTARDVASSAGVSLPRSASLWAYFVIHAANFLNQNGRLAFLLPSSFLQSQYAKAVHEFLDSRFENIWTIRVQERIYPEAEEETVILLAAGFGRKLIQRRHYEVKDLDELRGVLSSRPGSDRFVTGRNGMDARLHEVRGTALRLLREVDDNPHFSMLGDVADVKIGVVTGANSIFTMSAAEAATAKLDDLVEPVIARNQWVESSVFDRRALDEADRKQYRNRILRLDEASAERPEVWEVLRRAEKLEIHRGSHARRRNPWWQIKFPHAPDAILPYMGQDVRGLALNEVNAFATNALHHVYFHGGKSVETPMLALSSWSSVFALAAEMRGRYYGGGVLKIEPSTAKFLPVVTRGSGMQLAGVGSMRDQADAMVAALMGWSETELRILAEARSALYRRRTSKPARSEE